MKTLIEAFVSVFMVMVICFIGMQMILSNMQISNAREYHAAICEKIENNGLSKEEVNKIVEKVNSGNSGKLYHVDIEEVNGYEDKTSYHVSLTYTIHTPYYDIFRKSEKKQGIIDGYASVGGNQAKLQDVEAGQNGNVKTTFTDISDNDSNITATLYENGKLIIEGSGQMINMYNERSPFDDYNSDITNVVIQKGITNIPSYMFAKLRNLQDIIIPNTVKSVDTCAFYSCSSLKTATIPISVSAIGEYAFSKCTSLETLYLDAPKGKISIPDNIFQGNDIETEIAYLR